LLKTPTVQVSDVAAIAFEIADLAWSRAVDARVGDTLLRAEPRLENGQASLLGETGVVKGHTGAATDRIDIRRTAGWNRCTESVRVVREKQVALDKTDVVAERVAKPGRLLAKLRPWNAEVTVALILETRTHRSDAHLGLSGQTAVEVGLAVTPTDRLDGTRTAGRDLRAEPSCGWIAIAYREFTEPAREAGRSAGATRAHLPGDSGCEESQSQGNQSSSWP